MNKMLWWNGNKRGKLNHEKQTCRSVTSYTKNPAGAGVDKI
jgi:hypothetical protein